ncbi:glycoside hydrolase family 88 protein [Labilibaculum sp. DW002]|uniref:Glycoside hydrolase family 88 protein n=1 Tax=Paralabilibaculum antarcticum TaxID=2912572 RepID=A0ABT5VUV6_9BACT|nr:glycoside hydrolase family 88 protein [Labilibaculum sp. DW002]MDE5419086.1 glycoside hydrolase family 88 protein [Labilibaculum sp. DW002]
MRFVKIFVSVISIVLVLSSCASFSKDKKTLDASKILMNSSIKIKESAERLSDTDHFPRFIPQDSTNWECVSVGDWCSGFWPGALWYAYECSGDENLRKQAELFTAPIKEIAYTPAQDHDIGFQVYCSYGNGYRLTGNPEYKKIMLAAADTLATLYNPIVGSIHSWPSKKQYPHNTIIDNMMNLELLFWAAKNGGGERLKDIAVSHAEVTMNNIVRPDYSAFHLGSFDDKTGAFIEGKAHQGYADNSMWARGQAWGIYGFAFTYRESGKKEFLETSMKMADKFLERLPEDGIPYWDFDAPLTSETPKDASAAAVAACGMLELYKIIDDEVLRNKYKQAAIALLEILSSPKYLSGDTNQAILLHSTGHKPKNSEIDVPIIYADYYYLEALLKLKKIEAGEVSVK